MIGVFLLNKELLRLNHSPCILDDPTDFYFKGVDSMVAEILKG